MCKGCVCVFISVHPLGRLYPHLTREHNNQALLLVSSQECSGWEEGQALSGPSSSQQGWRLHHLSGQPVPDCPHGEKPLYPG